MYPVRRPENFDEAVTACTWALDQTGSRRTELINGHRARRKPITGPDGWPATDHTEANAWIIAQYVAAGSPLVAA